jgi:hypothetical protein
MTPERVRLVSRLVPGFCLLVSAVLIVSRHSAFTAAARAESRLAADLQTAQEEAEAAKRITREARVTCVPRTPGEETAFLLDMRHRAQACGVSIVRWTSRSTDYAPKEGETPTTDQKAVLGVTKVSCDIGLAGSYPALRALLTDLGQSDRLLTLSRIEWGRTEKGSELSMSLSRYLAPKESAPKS